MAAFPERATTCTRRWRLEEEYWYRITDESMHSAHHLVRLHCHHGLTFPQHQALPDEMAFLARMHEHGPSHACEILAFMFNGGISACSMSSARDGCSLTITAQLGPKRRTAVIDGSPLAMFFLVQRLGRLMKPLL